MANNKEREDFETYKKMQALKCIRCGTTEELRPYYYVQSRSATGTYTGSVKARSYDKVPLPVCQSCYEMFHERNRYRLYSLILGIICGVFILAILVFNFTEFIDPQELLGISPELLNWILIFLVGFTFPWWLFRYISLNKMPGNIEKYTEGNGSLSIKDQKTGKWIPYHKWIEKTEAERSRE